MGEFFKQFGKNFSDSPEGKQVYADFKKVERLFYFNYGFKNPKTKIDFIKTIPATNMHFEAYYAALEACRDMWALEDRRRLILDGSPPVPEHTLPTGVQGLPDSSQSGWLFGMMLMLPILAVIYLISKRFKSSRLIPEEDFVDLEMGLPR